VEVLRSVAGCTSFGHSTNKETREEPNTSKYCLNEISVDYTCQWKLRVKRPRRTKLEVAYRMLQLMFTAHPAK
jgi:hypothetical protein